ncbi:MAG: PqqD family protein [Clostridia bacterium]|nr:PqqD family protein [Clostridia bacterium]
MFRLKDGFIVRKIGDQIMAVPVGTRTSDLHGMIVLSESAELLWEALKEGAELDDLVSILTENYDVETDVALRDAENFIENLKKQGALI